MLDEAQLVRALANPHEALKALDKVQSERRLIDFMQLGWHALEPGAKFVPNWGVHAICDHLEAVTRGDIKRLLINVPPGCTKSMTVGVFWPTWEWGPKELAHHRFLCGAHKVALAERDGKRARDLINSEWYQALWGDQFEWKKDQATKVNYENSKTGWRIASAAATMTGQRGDRVIIDDPHSVEGAESEAERETTLRTFSETVPTRLNDQDKSAIIVIMQRIHERDVSGHILAHDLGYEHLMLPMEFEPERRCYSSVKPSHIDNPTKTTVYYNKETRVWQPDYVENDGIPAEKQERYNVDVRSDLNELLDPVRFPRNAIEDLKAALSSWGGSYAVAGQLQQRPAPRGGGMFKKSDFTIVDKAPEGGRAVRGWDLATSTTKTSPYTVGTKMKMVEGKVYILDVDRDRQGPHGMEQMLINCADRDGHSVKQDIPQDPGQAGKAQKAHLAAKLHGYDVSFSPESGDKETRASPLAAQAEAGNVFLVRADWNDTFLAEAALFPNGMFKDQVDAASRAYAALVKKKPKKKTGIPQTVSTA